MTKILTLFVFLAWGILNANVEPYLKKITDKEGSHQIRNIDFIYMINMDERPEKYAQSMDQLSPYGINPYRFSAVNGWELTNEAINAVGVVYQNGMRDNLMATTYLPDNIERMHHEIMHVPGRNYFCHCLSRGAIGICLSHLSILKDAYDSGYETIWVMEDDIQVIQNPHQISEMIDKLDSIVGKNGWDFLFTDFDTKGQDGKYVTCMSAALRPAFNPSNPFKFAERFHISPELRYVGARYGAYSMIIRRSGMKKMLDFLSEGIFLPYDMEYTLPNDIRMFTVIEDIVSTMPTALSDNGAPNYKLNLLEKGRKTMDLNNGNAPAINYEMNAYEGNRLFKNEKAKAEALTYMSKLEGWCSTNKASILMEMIFRLQPEVVVEIGVFGGKSLIPMAKALQVNGKGMIYGIDPWDANASVVGMDKINADWWGKLDHVSILKNLQARIVEFNLTDHIELIVATSQDAKPIENIDMIHIDGNHSEQSSLIDVQKWVPLVKSGGLILFDDVDWSMDGVPGNAAAVRYLDEVCTRITFFDDLNRWGMWVKP